MKQSNFLEHISNLSRETVEKKLRAHSALFFEVGQKVEMLIDEHFKLKQALELKESQIYRNLSVKYAASKKITPTRINHEVNANSELQELKTKLREVNKALGVARLRKETLNGFREVLINFNHNIRQQKKQTEKG